MTRILTYNVHRCLGTDRRLDVGRIAEVIAGEQPDIVALQEVDVGRARTGGVDQAHELARRLGMAFHFNAALKVEEELYGDAILTILPERLVKAAPLPGYRPIPQLEPRGALWVQIETADGPLQVINTHLGLAPQEQRLQAQALAGPDWLGGKGADRPLILVGDFNATPLAKTYRILAAELTQASTVLRRRGGSHFATFPSAMPVLRLDHFFVRGAVSVQALRVAESQKARLASDHLPLVMDFALSQPHEPHARHGSGGRRGTSA